MSSPSDEGAVPLGAAHSLVARRAVPVDERVEQAERALPCGLRVFHRRVVEKRLHQDTASLSSRSQALAQWMHSMPASSHKSHQSHSCATDRSPIQKAPALSAVSSAELPTSKGRSFSMKIGRSCGVSVMR